MAINKAVKYTHTEYANKKTKFSILSDSLGNSTAITNTQNSTDITKLIREKISLAEKKGNQIQCNWIAGHVDTPGNGRADHEAPDAIVSSTSLTTNSSTYSDTKNVTNTYINNRTSPA